VRTSQRWLNPAEPYHWPDFADGAGVHIYVFDTGIYLQHNEFEGRAFWGTNTADNTTTDGNGHGTHCAGIAAGKTYGLAKRATLVAVKVLTDQGTGSTQGVIDGINWAVSHHNRPSVGSMSVGGTKSPSLNSAVAAATEKGMQIVTAAGNSNANACEFSPGSTPQVITVTASDGQDKRAPATNWGPCVTLYAPGVSITSAWIGKPDSTATLTGTSAATPHVAGEAAKYLETNKGASASEVKSWIENHAQKNVIINGHFGGTPNLLLFADCWSFER